MRAAAAGVGVARRGGFPLLCIVEVLQEQIRGVDDLLAFYGGGAEGAVAEGIDGAWDTLVVSVHIGPTSG